jgi:outer membrane protein assembly factor BamE (lipoprotein component of BamABCDE complex)
MTGNDEARMTNDETMKKKHSNRRISSFGFRHSFVIRHSSFVIRLVAFLFAFAACHSSRTITKANVDEVVDGMSKKQVESILGLPTTVDSKDAQLKRTTYVYVQGKESVTIVFKEDKVQSKASTLSE